jgi:hypothetical protein
LGIHLWIIPLLMRFLQTANGKPTPYPNKQ